MGKMLETLKIGDARRPLGTSGKLEPPPAAQDCVVDWEIGAEVPFVEVGGPNKTVELSPGLVMKHPPQSPQPPHTPSPAVEAPPKVEAPAVSVAPKAVHLTEAHPMKVGFESYPGKAIRASIAPEIIAYHQPEHATSKEYALLLDKMLGAMKSPHASVILLIGVRPKVGASTVLLNLAGVAARQNRRVVVVDANFARSGLAQRLGQGDASGLEEVLEGTLALDEAVVATAIPFVHLLPAGAGTEAFEYLTTEAITWLVGLLRDRFDVILIDGPVLEEKDEIAMHAPHTDAMYLVVPRGEQLSAHKSTAQTISRMGGRLCGLIHTHFEM